MIRRWVLVSVVLISMVAGVPVRAADSFEQHDAMVTMSDGIMLDASVYLPAGTAEGAELPLIVRQHGGGSNKDNSYDRGYGLKLVEAGFALLMYSHRGHGNSGGIFDFFGPRTTQDFSDMLDWVEATFGDKIDTANVGASGYSQGGGESFLPAERDDRVKALAVGNTFADLNVALNPNDCFKFSFATGIFAGAYTVSGARVDDATAIRWGTQFYTDTEDVAIDPAVPSTTADLHQRSPLTFLDSLVRRRVPVFWAQSWEDQLFPGDHLEKILRPLEDAGVPVHYWFSSGGHAAGADDLDDQIGKEQAMLNWFDQFLRGNDHGYTTGPKVDYAQRISGGFREPGIWEHHTAPAWPVSDARLSLFPQADGSLRDAHGGGPAVGTIANSYVSANVANDALVNEVGANVPSLDPMLAKVPENANPADSVTFVGAPLASPLTVVGAPIADIPVSPVMQSVPKAIQLNAKIWDIAPDDSRRLINRGCDSIDDQFYALPFSNQFRFELWPNAHTFEKGHRIGLTLSTVDFPTFKPDVFPNVMEILASSRIELPVLS